MSSWRRRRKGRDTAANWIF